MAVNPFAVPAAPGSYGFSPDLLYQFKIDNDGNAVENFVVQFKFTGRLSGQTVQVFGPARPRQVGAQNKILSTRPTVQGSAGTTLGSSSGLQAFTGLRDDPFVFDLGQFNRILGGLQDLFRAANSPALGPLSGREIRADGTSGVDGFGGFNASYLMVSFPKSWVRGRTSRINIWGTVSRAGEGRGNEFDDSRRSRGSDHSRTWVQFERMGQQVFNTVFTPSALKDAFNASVPAHDEFLFSRFVPDALTSNDSTGNTIAARAAVLEAVGVTALPNGVPLLLPGSFVNIDRGLIRKAVLPDVLRLDLDLAANDLGIGQFGLQNGRRPNDDAIDIALRLLRQLADVNFPAGSGLPGSGTPRPGALNFPADRRVFVVLQGTDFIEPDAAAIDLSTAGNDKDLPASFPFIAAPHPLPGQPGTIGFPGQE
jgi:hypothetical protein